MQIKGSDQSPVASKQRLELHSSVKYKSMKKWPMTGCTIICEEQIDVPRSCKQDSGDRAVATEPI